LKQERPETAISLTLMAGALIVIGSLIMAFMTAWFFSGFDTFCPGTHMIAGVLGSAIMPLMAIIGAATGFLVIFGAVRLISHPKEHRRWGMLIVVFSIIGLAGMGGFLIGTVLGVIGGTMALSWRPRDIPG
jgi:hypothetical protein